MTRCAPSIVQYGFRTEVAAERASRIKKGYRIDVRTSSLIEMCYSNIHQSMYMIENNCQDDIQVKLQYYGSRMSQAWSPRQEVIIITYKGPRHIVKPGQILQLHGPEGYQCQIKIKTKVDTKWKTIGASKVSFLHTGFVYRKDGTLTYYGLIMEDSASSPRDHEKCREKYNFRPPHNIILAALPDRFSATVNSRVQEK